MAKNDNLKDFLTDVADAIREKKGSTDKINPQDFSAEILSIIAGDVQMPNVSGTLVITEGITEDDYEALKLILGNNITIDAQGGILIHFADPEVLRVLLAKGVGDGTGITTAQAEAVTNIDNLFKDNAAIISFNELGKFGVRTISNTFYNCANLQVVDTSKLTTINAGTFYNCTKLKAVDLINVTTLNSSTGRVSTFGGCTSLESVRIGNIVNIPNGCFDGCSALTSINLDQIKNVQGVAFNKCTSLLSVNLNKCETLGARAFADCSSLENIGDECIPNIIEDGCFLRCVKLKRINLRNVKILTGTGNIATGGVFYNCAELEEVGDVGNIERLDLGAFYGCIKLTELNFTDKLTYIGQNVFDGCSALTSVGNLSSVTSIGYRAFLNCTALTSVILRDVTNVAQESFKNCLLLKSVDLSNVTSIGNNAFNGCSALTSINLSNATSIGTSAFAGCTSLADIGSLNEGITSLNTTFYNCAFEIEDVSLPNLVTFAGEVFKGCKIKKFSNLGKITSWSCGNSDIYETFGKKDYLEEVVLPDTVTEIPAHGFRAYTALKYIRANNIVKVGGVALNKCTSLRELFPTDKITSWGAHIPESEYITFFHLPICTSTEGEIGRANTTGITTAILPAVTTLSKYWMYNPTTIYIYLRDATSIGESGIHWRWAVWVIENETPANMTITQAFGAFGDAYAKIYVPDSALQTYATATNWSTYYDNGQIKGISQLATDYPDFYAILKGTAEGYEDMAKWGYLNGY